MTETVSSVRTARCTATRSEIPHWLITPQTATIFNGYGPRVDTLSAPIHDWIIGHTSDVKYILVLSNTLLETLVCRQHSKGSRQIGAERRDLQGEDNELQHRVSAVRVVLRLINDHITPIGSGLDARADVGFGCRKKYLTGRLDMGLGAGGTR
jgi:hypothetical protein